MDKDGYISNGDLFQVSLSTSYLDYDRPSAGDEDDGW